MLVQLKGANDSVPYAAHTVVFTIDQTGVTQINPGTTVTTTPRSPKTSDPGIGIGIQLSALLLIASLVYAGYKLVLSVKRSKS